MISCFSKLVLFLFDTNKIIQRMRNLYNVVKYGSFLESAVNTLNTFALMAPRTVISLLTHTVTSKHIREYFLMLTHNVITTYNRLFHFQMLMFTQSDLITALLKLVCALKTNVGCGTA